MCMCKFIENAVVKYLAKLVKMRYFVLVALVSLSPAKVSEWVLNFYELISLYFPQVHLVIRFSKLLRNSTHPMTIYEKCHIERVNKITTITIWQKLLQPIYSIQVSMGTVLKSQREIEIITALITICRQTFQ